MSYKWKGRVAISIITGIGWIVFLTLWLFFYAEDYSGYQNLAVFIVSLLVIGVIQSVVWIPWRMKWKREMK